MPIYALGDRRPVFPEGRCWIAPTAVLIGLVILEEDANIWFGAVLRGDNEPIRIGRGSNVQENTLMHTDPGKPLTVGADCTIGHGAIVHGCTIGDGSLIGMGATILNEAVIGRNCIVGANALVTEGKVFPDNSLIVGSPARVVRTLDPDSPRPPSRTAGNYVRKSQLFAAELKEIG